MKVCKFCSAVCDDSVNKCPSCGGLEFRNKCANCGTIFDTSHCPNCGVKVGEEARICPKCNTKYFSASCPTCGYNVNSAQQSNIANQQTINYYNTVSTAAPPIQPAPKKKLTIWTILLWVFFWPIMIIITVWKSKKLDLKWKIIITAIAAIAFIVLGIAGQSENTTEIASTDPTSSQSQSVWASSITPLSEFDYYIEGNEIYLKDYNGYGEKVRIPDSYDVDGTTMTVVSLDGTFALERVKSVILPNTLRDISNNCFNSCGIEFLYIPSSLKEVQRAFWGYFHDLEKIYYQGTETQWNTLCTVDRSDVDVKQIVFEANAADLK